MPKDWTPQEIEYTKNLVTSGVFFARHINKAVFNQPEFKRWSNESLLVAMACLSAAYARGVQLPIDDFLLLCTTAYSMIDAEPSTSDLGKPPE